MSFLSTNTLQQADNEIFEIVEEELHRQTNHLEMKFNKRIVDIFLGFLLFDKGESLLLYPNHYLLHFQRIQR